MINDAAIYKGNYPYDNAVYIESKLRGNGSSHWTAAIMTNAPENNFGYYICYVPDYWADLIQFGSFNWTYSISRY